MNSIRKPFQALLFALLPALSWSTQAADTLEGWVLTLSWSPQYCKLHAGSKETQCLEENYWVVHGATPVLSTGLAKDCAEVPALEAAQLDRLLLLVPNRAEITRRWRREGGCTGADASQYAMQLDYASRRVTIPERYKLVSEDSAEPLASVRDAFVKANRGLKPNGVVFECARRYLTAASFCFDRSMNFSECRVVRDEKCRDEVKLRGIDRERLR